MTILRGCPFYSNTVEAPYTGTVEGTRFPLCGYHLARLGMEALATT